jgi:hypothetical protein
MNKEVKEAVRLLKDSYEKSAVYAIKPRMDFMKVMKTIGFTENSVYEACPELKYRDQKDDKQNNKFF